MKDDLDTGNEYSCSLRLRLVEDAPQAVFGLCSALLMTWAASNSNAIGIKVACMLEANRMDMYEHPEVSRAVTL